MKTKNRKPQCHMALSAGRQVLHQNAATSSQGVNIQRSPGGQLSMIVKTQHNADASDRYKPFNHGLILTDLTFR